MENRFGLFYLRFPLSGNWIRSFFSYGSPSPSKKVIVIVVVVTFCSGDVRPLNSFKIKNPVLDLD